MTRSTVLLKGDGLTTLPLSLWRPAGQPRGVVQVIHGMKEHMGRYHWFAARLAEQGFAVCGQDLAGHGRARRQGETFGYFGREQGAARLVGDCRKVSRFLQREYPGVPLFLLGHSMGSLIGRIYILHYAWSLAGFICMGTVGENPLAPYARLLAEGLARRNGAKAPGKLLDKLTFARVNERFPGEGAHAWLSRDPAVGDAYESDPLIEPLFTNAGFQDLYDLQMAANAREWYDRVDKSLPVLLLGGSEDPVGEYGTGPAEVYSRLREEGLADAALHLYDGARHELLHETCRSRVVDDILDWLERHLTGWH